MAEHWHSLLPEPIALNSGISLQTLLDVGAFMREQFHGRRTPPVEATIALVLRAAETGSEIDRRVAYDRLSRLLQFNRWIGPCDISQ